MTRRKEVLTAVILLAWICGCVGQGVKAHRAMKEEIEMARVERECIETLTMSDEFYNKARAKQREVFGFDDSQKQAMEG